MSTSPLRETYRKLVAFRSGGNIDRFERKHLHIHNDPIMISFVRLGGLNLPIGAIFGRAKDNGFSIATISSLEDATNFERITEVLEKVALYILEEFGVGPKFSSKPLQSGDVELTHLEQLWLPDKANFEMLKNLEIAFFEEPSASSTALETFARLCGFLFESAALSGDHQTVVAAKLLNETNVLALDDQLSSNLAACLAFLSQTEESVEAKTQAGIQASLRNNGMTLTKPVEDLLANATDKRNFQAILSSELESRGDLLREAWRVSHFEDKRKPNATAGVFALESANRFRTFLSDEFHEDPGALRAFRAPISESNQLDAAKSFIDLQAAEQRYDALMVHDDKEILQELIHRGDAFFGVCEHIEKHDDGSTVWLVRLDKTVGSLFKRRESSGFCLIGDPSNDVATLESFDKGQDEWLLKLVWDQIEIQHSTLVEQQDNLVWQGKTVIFVPKFSDITFIRQRDALKFASTSPGRWVLEEVGHIG